MKAIRWFISVLLIVGYLVGLTNNLMPRCESEYEHQKHIVSIHNNHFHNSSNSSPEIAHIGHEDHDDETSVINILQHIFDDVDNPKEKCEFGFFANVHNHVADIKSLAIIAVLKYPAFFIPAFESSKEIVDYTTPNYSPPDQQNQNQRGPPIFLV
ncbi:hypothetical protein ERX46_02875 [Brumimicrobium glaciale]|uniref:Uncharacterized protein n=1 Tax=Brumimicrobium glaciale TaxID=200475 RepID=A0A4Q4KSD1_9FLAO|nr:hypothetical protein [Brumimicrobium glaciale]RYM35955.1 hypothetical protein ERX46_02875 [Brumimicrobium glaciale]